MKGKSRKEATTTKKEKLIKETKFKETGEKI